MRYSDINKKVCHITSAHNRYDVRIFEKECKSLANNGYDVTLLVNDDKEDEVIDNVRIISTKFKAKNRIDRFLHAGKKMYKKAMEANAAIYHFHDPDLIPLGNKLKRINKKVIFDSHENVPQQIKDKKWIPLLIRNLISKAYEFYETSSVRKYDAIISVTPHIVERFRSINVNTSLVTNYPIIDINEEKVRRSEKTICFAGGVSEQWGHQIIIKAIEDIEGVKYILVGNGTKEYLAMLKSLPAWDKVDYKGKVPHSEVKNIYAQSIAGMAINYSSQAKEEGTLGNTKLFEYMDAKLPVICSNYKLWNIIVNENKCGICVDPNNIEQIRNAIEYIINNPEEAEVMGENGRNAVIENYNWKTQEKVLLDLYQKL